MREKMERMKKWDPRWELNRKQDQSHLIDIWIFMGQTLTFVRLALVLLLWLLMGAMTARAHCYHRCSCTQTIQLPPKIFHHHLFSNQQIRQMKNHSTKINVIYVFALIAPHFHWPRARAWLLCVFECGFSGSDSEFLVGRNWRSLLEYYAEFEKFVPIFFGGVSYIFRT